MSPDDPTVPASIELGEGSQEQGGVPSLPSPRKSTRSNVSQHSNPHHEPKSALSHSAVSQMIANLGTVFFREAVKELRNSYTVTEDVDRSKSNQNQIKSNQIKSNQIKSNKSNQIKSLYCHITTAQVPW